LTPVGDDRLGPYREKRSAERTPEPVPPPGPLPVGNDDTFVIQEHHARRLHWDLRLERGGVLVSWAVPKGLPSDPRRNHLAVHTEDHPLEYASFAGTIAAGEYGGGEVTIWDAGTYDCETWTDREVKVVLHGSRARGRYALFQTRGQDWMIHRMDPPPPGWEPMPELVRPMLATLGQLPPASEDDSFGYEMKWDGVRAVVYVDGGTVRVVTRNDREVSASYPELRGLGEALGSTRVVLDGEIVAVDRLTGRISFAALQERMHVQDAARARRLAERVPVTYLVFDLLYLDGRSTLTLPYTQRRAFLEGLGVRGPHWDVPPSFAGSGADVVAASREQGLEGVLAKRLTSAYEPGRRSRHWVKVKNVRTQEVVVGGWRPGQGSRAGAIGSLLLGIPAADGLGFVGQVGTGFSGETLRDLQRRLNPLRRQTSPFADAVPPRLTRDARWVTPRLVGEVQFAEWTRDGRLRHPSWRGLRPDKAVRDVVRESS
jgi:bifunctional non-homologous end joining protein LigD